MERDHLLRQGEDGEVCQGPLFSWISARCDLEALLQDLANNEGGDQAGLRKAEIVAEEEAAPLHTKTNSQRGRPPGDYEVGA